MAHLMYYLFSHGPSRDPPLPMPWACPPALEAM